ncbi:MAG: PilZ domain-containing protein [Candidatus Omnitrophica bacterium]|nr:PilZ domain-containing protein [Candidatus Omnitrophota bacterium]MBU1933173.1 PilZ domain-containing protein [Candidatus Omnitrophota bacterium]
MWSGINRRKFPRANYPCVISVKRKDQDDSVSAKTENIGIGGICVMLPKDLGIFAPVEIQLDLMDGQPVIRCDGAIVWVVAKKTDKNKIFDTGIEFTDIKRKDAMRINDVVEKILSNNE